MAWTFEFPKLEIDGETCHKLTSIFPLDGVCEGGFLERITKIALRLERYGEEKLTWN